jgi:hypothetical protein
MFALRKNAKATLAHRSPPARPAPSAFAKSAIATELSAPSELPPICLLYSEEMMRAFLRTIPPGEYQAEDFLDDDGVNDKPVRIAVTIRGKTQLLPREKRLAASEVSHDEKLTLPQSPSTSPAATRKFKVQSTRSKRSPTRRASMSFAACYEKTFPRHLA